MRRWQRPFAQVLEHWAPGKGLPFTVDPTVVAQQLGAAIHLNTKVGATIASGDAARVGGSEVEKEEVGHKANDG